MTDTAFVPGQMRAADPEAPADEQNGTNRSPLLFLAGGALVVVLAIAGWFLFLSGGAGPLPQAETPVAPTSQPVVPTVVPSPVTDGTATSARTKHGFRDPFKALIAPAAAGTGTTSAAGGAAAGSTTAGTTAGSTTTTTGSTTTGATTPTGSTAHTLKVVSVASNNTAITVKVDGKTYKNLKAGEVFAKFFKVIGIGGQVNVIQFGDEKFNISGTKAVTLAS
jgi:hypothetical protein